MMHYRMDLRKTTMRNLRWFLLTMLIYLTTGQTQGQSTVTALTPDPNNQLTMENAQMVVRLLALQSPNPYVREMAYHDHDADWTIDLKAKTFFVKIPGLQDNSSTEKILVIALLNRNNFLL